jgi:competence protein ComK
MIYALYFSSDQQITIKTHHEDKTAPLSTTKEVLSLMCLNQGATYEGRRRAVCEILKVKQKVPILLAPNELLFPTHSPDQLECAWINYFAILNYDKFDEGSIVTFIDGTNIIFPCNLRTIKMKVKSCSLYAKYLNYHECSS